MTGYYDFVLAFVPLSLLGTPVLLSVLGVSVQLGIFIGGLVSLLVISHSLFVRGPTSQNIVSKQSNENLIKDDTSRRKIKDEL
jgi:hypothetical protein